MPELDSCLFSTTWLGMLANRQGKKMQTCFLCMADYYLAANYKLLPVTFSWVDQALLQTEMYLCPTGDTCPVDCTGSQGQLLKMYLWLYLWPRGLLVQLKCWKKSVWIHISLETPSSLCLAGGCLLTCPWPTPLSKCLPRWNPLSPQNWTAKFKPQRPSASIGWGFIHLCGPKIFLCRAAALRSSPGFLCIPGCCCLRQCSLLEVELPWRPKAARYEWR